ncbi:hypothetical protein KC19_11G131800 [Ceratodon purpureus]|uniref:Uncharacterized protein n=1 Tax=Ceratodon purpureus TaxID=3225 RepID=A0A8T0GFN1_CERPU|nr:hypothetical protein KC19_11G131800 [Ceratodon purpureus]
MSNHDSNPSQLRTLHVNSHGRCVQILRITSIELHFEEVIAHIHGRRRFKKPPDNGFSNTKPELKNLNPTERPLQQTKYLRAIKTIRQIRTYCKDQQRERMMEGKLLAVLLQKSSALTAETKLS